MSQGTKNLIYDLERARNRIPDDGFIFTRVEVEKIAKALGGWIALNELLHSELIGFDDEKT